jgi:hypothetical protein
MTKLIAAVALATLIALPVAPAFADSTKVIVGGKVVGQDPDPNIRLQLLREAGSENY